MLEIWWVRHGSTDWNDIKRWQGATDIHLNEAGRQQALALRLRLKGIPFDAVWSSDLSRSYETAQLALPNCPILTDARLREIPMGIAEGKTWDELTGQQQNAIGNWWKDPYKEPFPGAQENLTDVTARVNAWRHEQPQQGRIICFTHGGTIRCLLWDIVGAPGTKAWTVELGNTGVMRVRYDGDHPILTAFNDMSHIKESWKMGPSQNVPGS